MPTTTEDNRSTKGDRSQAAMKAAARAVFRENGYLNARVQDIAALAGFSNGAFYRYFADKRAVMLSLLHDLLEDGYNIARAPWHAEQPLDSVLLTTERYLTFYRENDDLFRILVEVSQSDSEVEEMWSEVRAETIKRIERMLEKARTEKLLRDGVDIPVVASLLAAMTDQYAFLAFVTKRMPERTVAEVSRQLTDVWAHGVFSGPL